MARAAPPGALELLLHEATDPSHPEENWDCIQRFIDQVNADSDSSPVTLRLLEHKIQSPQEAEALHALAVLEMCVNNCGERFHREMGKFRFLNGLIKVLSPKYLGEWSTERVKSRIIEVMFNWTVWFPQEVKIRDAYQMLKQQGIVTQDPKLPEDKILPPCSPRPASSIFDADREKSQLLARLLKSKNPEDLQAANRLIKGLIKEEQGRSAKASRREKAVREALGSAEALEEMLSRCKGRLRVGGAQPALEALQPDPLQEMQARCEKLKPLLFQVASETVEEEEALAEILQANDRLTRALGFYQEVVGRCGSAPGSPVDVPGAAQPPPPASSLPLIRFSEAEETPVAAPSHGRLPPSSCSLDKELMAALDLSRPAAAPAPSSSLAPEVRPPPPPSLPVPGQGSLAGLFVPLDAVTLSTTPPVTVHEGKGLTAVLHFSRDLVPGQPATRVLVLSLLSTAPHPLRDIVFQAAVPKSMAIRLQPATGSRLPAFRPLQPPPVISQVLLLANPRQAPLRLRYRLLFTQNGERHSEVGEVTDFPPAELWGGS